MRLSTHKSQHRLHTVQCLLIDALLWMGAFFFGALIRFIGSPVRLIESAISYIPGLIFSSFALVSMIYVCGLYSTTPQPLRLRRRLVLLLACALTAGIVTLAAGSLNFSWQIGRGVLFLGAISATLLLCVHHTIIHFNNSRVKEKAVALITNSDDEVLTLLFKSLEIPGTELAGCFVHGDYVLHSDLERIGDTSEMETWIAENQVGRIFCSTTSTHCNHVARMLRRLRYSGVAISDITQPCEDRLQAIPVELINSEWLLNACSLPDHFYISKLKRAVDLTAAVSIGIISSPALLIGTALVKLTSPGPVFYKQERLGRFGHPFKILKLRTMTTDAEANGAQWSQKNDPRITPVGRILRKFRIDEIPQLWNILVGEMSFVGPRPEREEFAKQLAEQIPYFNERLLIHPGLTGWAQVCYPYGATTEDAKRKLEFDLYYLKNMGLILDLFVILDTIKIILRGGSSDRRGENLAAFEKGITAAVKTVSDSNIVVAQILRNA